MSRTIRHGLDGEKIRDGKIVSNACEVKTDGDVVRPETYEDNDPSYFNPTFKKELKRISSKKVRKTAKAKLAKDNEQADLEEQ